MRIVANVRGKFLEPFGNVGVRDAVSCLQLQAVTGEETQILQHVYKVLREGGTIRAISDRPGVIQILCEFDKPPSKAPESSPPVEAVETPVVQTVPASNPEAAQEHQHVYSVLSNCVRDPEGVWLGCACGNWAYFPHLVEPSDTEVKIPPPKVN